MNNHNLSLDYLSKIQYNDILKDHFVDLKAVNEEFPHIVVGIVDSATSKESLAQYLENLILDTRGHTRRGFPSTIMYILLTLFILNRPTPAIYSHEYFSKTLDRAVEQSTSRRRNESRVSMEASRGNRLR